VSEREGRQEENVFGLPRLPPGRHGLAREFVVKNQRDRLTAGIIAAVAERGYHDATVTQICAAAGVSRRTFYTYFSSKEECFLEAFNRVVDFLSDAMREAEVEGTDWPGLVRERFTALLNVFAANPDLVRFALIAPPRAGEGLAAHQRAALDRLLEVLTVGRPNRVRVTPSAVEQALLGGGMSLIARKVEKGEGSSLPELLPDLVELFLTPYVGREEAIGVARSTA
jgi:AcrR family transcriptional regulator